MATKRMTSNDYAKELHKLKLDEMALEKHIRERLNKLIELNPDVVIVENFMGSESNLLAKNYKHFINDDIQWVLHIIQVIEDDLASKHPHKQTEIQFPKTQHEKIMDIAKRIQALNIPENNI
jgi:hypothetical protein